jgi:hypothetical protein
MIKLSYLHTVVLQIDCVEPPSEALKNAIFPPFFGTVRNVGFNIFKVTLAAQSVWANINAHIQHAIVYSYIRNERNNVVAC